MCNENKKNWEKARSNLVELQNDLCNEISVGGLKKRNATAHKWMAPFRFLLARELVAWRFTDLMIQAATLMKNDHIVGTRILFRSVIETLVILISSNQKVDKVFQNTIELHEFDEFMYKLTLGSRNGFTKCKSINILTLLDKSKADYPELQIAYESLSETCHPNWEGLDLSYSKANNEERRYKFGLFANQVFSEHQGAIFTLLLSIFFIEYEERSSNNFEKLEAWLVEHDFELENKKSQAVENSPPYFN